MVMQQAAAMQAQQQAQAAAQQQHYTPEQLQLIQRQVNRGGMMGLKRFSKMLFVSSHVLGWGAETSRHLRVEDAQF